MSLFHQVAQPDFRWRSLATSCAVHAAAVAVLMASPLFFKDPLPVDRHLPAIHLIDPAPPRRILPPLMPAPAPVARLSRPARTRLLLPVRVPTVPPRPVIPAPEAPPLALQPPALPPFQYPALPMPPAPRVKEPVRTEVFGAVLILRQEHIPARPVQTGAFGHPHGVVADRQVRALVASAGFGDPVPAPNAPGPARAFVRESGFAALQPAPEAPQRPRFSPPRLNEAAHTEPVEILFKPKPGYTAEARAARVEGDVALEILFRATGEPQVLRVVRGLGYGLDESASRAASQIRFKPARRGGKLVDYTAVVRVVFQMAY